MAEGHLPQNSADSLYQISPDSVLLSKVSLEKGWFRVEYPFVEGFVMLSLSGVCIKYKKYRKYYVSLQLSGQTGQILAVILDCNSVYLQFC